MQPKRSKALIEISRKIVRQVKDVVRRTLAVKSSKPPVIGIESGSNGLALRAQNQSGAVEYRLTGEFEAASFTLPYDFVVDCEGRDDRPVIIEQVGDDQVAAQWRDGSIPQVVRYDVESNSNRDAFPEMPTELRANELRANEPRIITALANAMATTDSGSIRYSLGSVQLCGDTGRIAASDGRQLYTETELKFGFDGQVLIPRNTVFQSKALPTDQPVNVGVRDDWVAFVIGPWTVCLKLLEDGQFPNVDSVLHNQGQATGSVSMHHDDAKFLLGSLKRLPGSSEANKPITVDLNGHVAVRAQDDRQQVTELRLSNSTRSGDPIRFISNRDYLNRAMQMGLRDMQVFGKDKPVQCTGNNRTYLWAVLEADEAVKPSDDAVVVESPTAGPDQRSDNTQTRKRETMTRAKPPGADTSATVPQQTTTNGDDVIQRAETLRTWLRETLQHTTTLVADLKRQRKQNKALRSTLASLRQLQAVDV